MIITILVAVFAALIILCAIFCLDKVRWKLRCLNIKIERSEGKGKRRGSRIT